MIKRKTIREDVSEFRVAITNSTVAITKKNVISGYYEYIEIPHHVFEQIIKFYFEEVDN